MKNLNRALVVGAGIGGLCAAIALRRAGVAVDVVEERAGGGAVYHVGIILQANVLRAMERLGVAQATIAGGYPTKGVRYLHAHDGSLIAERTSIRAPGFAHLPDLGIGRPALHEVLDTAARAAGAAIRLGTTYAAIDQSDSDAAEVTFTDGTKGRYDIVVASDGAYSRTRRMLFGDRYVNRYTGQAVWRYNLPRPKDLDWMLMFEGIRGRKAGVVPLTESTMYLLLTSEEPGNPRMPAERLDALLRERLEGFGGLIAQVRDQVNDPKLVVYRPLEGILVPSPWYQGRVLLIGDAVHTPTPHLAMGAGMAIEDAVVLGELAGEDLPVATLLERFMQRRFDRCRQIWEASVQIGEWEMRPTPDADPVTLGARMQALFAQPL